MCFCTPLTLAALSPTMGFCMRFSMNASSSMAGSAELIRLGSTHAPTRDQSSSSFDMMTINRNRTQINTDDPRVLTYSDSS